MTPSESTNAALRIASLLRVAKRDLDDAVALHERNSANASYHLEQAAEKVLLAVCISEEIHIPRQKAHQLDENILLLPDENPVKAELKSVGYLVGYATTFRYPTDKGRIVEDMPKDRFDKAFATVKSILETVAEHFQVRDLSIDARVPAGNVRVMRFSLSVKPPTNF
jgi:HEPN domain-containing protein